MAVAPCACVPDYADESLASVRILFRGRVRVHRRRQLGAATHVPLGFAKLDSISVIPRRGSGPLGRLSVPDSGTGQHYVLRHLVYFLTAPRSVIASSRQWCEVNPRKCWKASTKKLSADGRLDFSFGCGVPAMVWSYLLVEDALSSLRPFDKGDHVNRTLSRNEDARSILPPSS